MPDQNNPSHQDEETAHRKRKPPISVRIWRSLWRRRTWRKMGGHPSVNWAEIVTICITLAILIVSGTQAYIYWQQEQVMQSSLGQNERAAILAQGQLAIASRTLEEMKKGGGDTHQLAVAAGKQADASGITANATANVSATTRESLTSVQRAFISFVGVALRRES